MASSSLPEAITALTTKTQQVLDTATGIALNAVTKADIADFSTRVNQASADAAAATQAAQEATSGLAGTAQTAVLATFAGAEAIGYQGQGTGARLRTASAKFRESVSILDYANTDGSVNGNGVTDDYGMFSRALAANPGKRILVPDPASKWINKTGKLTIPANTSLVGATPFSTQFSHEFNGDMFEMGEGASLINFNFPGNGDTYTGRCFVYSGTAGRQLINNVRAQGWEDPVQYYGATAGSQCVNQNVIYARRNALTGTGRFAVVIDPTPQAGAVPRKFIGLETDGQCAIDFGGCNNVFISSSTMADLQYTADSRAVHILGSRILNQAALTLNGHNNTINGCDILPQITIALNADNCHLGANSYNTLPIIDNSGNFRNTITHWTAQYTPTLTSGGTAPSLGNGSIVSTYTRTGGTTTIEGQISIGSTTTLGTGGLSISLPQKRHNGFIFCGGTVVMNRGGTLYTGTLQIAGAVTTATFLRDTSGAITFNSPATFATGDTIRWSATYTN